MSSNHQGDIEDSADGLILANLNDIKTMLGEGLKINQSESTVAEEAGYTQFHIGLMDWDAGAIAAADIDITGITQTMYRSRKSVSGGQFTVAGITQPVFAKAVGRVYDAYRWLDAQWRAGDVYRLTVSGIVITNGGKTFELPMMVWSNEVLEAQDVKVMVEATKAGVDDLREAPYLTVGLPTYWDKPQTGSRVFKVEIKIRDLDGDMQDPNNNILGVNIYNEQDGGRNANTFQDYAATTALTTIAAGDLAGFRTCMRDSAGQYYFYYRVQYVHQIEELLYNFGWADALYGAGNAEYHVECNQVVDDDISGIRDELDDLSEAPVFQVALQDLLIKPQTGTKYVRVEATFKDLDGDMADPNNNLIAIRVYNSATTTRNTHLYKDVAGAAALDAAGIWPFGAYLALEREAQGLYYFYYQLEQDNPLEELIFRFGWHDIVYYEEGPVAFHVEAAELVANGSVIHNAARAAQNITTEKEITDSDRYSVTDGQLLKLQVNAEGVSNDATLTIRSTLIETAPGATVYEIHNDEVVVSGSATSVSKTCMTFTVNLPFNGTAADLAVYVTSDDAGDTSVGIEVNVIEVGGL